MRRLTLGLCSVLIALRALGADVAAPNPAHVHHLEAPSAPAEMPSASLQQLPVRLEEHALPPYGLVDLAGRPTVVTLLYTRCTAVCPAIVLTLQRLVSQLSDHDRHSVQVLIVSLDSTNDTPEVMETFAREHHMTGDPWHLAHASASDVRLLAAALGIRYRELPDGSFSHSSVLTLLDASGVPVARTEQLGQVDDGFWSALQGLLH